MLQFNTYLELHQHMYTILTTEPVTTIKFTKKNGEERVMKATKMMSEIPKEKHPKNKENKDYNFESKNIVVFDTEKESWRSFTLANIISINSVFVNIKEDNE